MLRIYRAPDGRTYQYDEGTQPEGYVEDVLEVKSKPKPSTKARKAPANKARTTARTKTRKAQSKDA